MEVFGEGSLISLISFNSEGVQLTPSRQGAGGGRSSSWGRAWGEEEILSLNCLSRVFESPSKPDTLIRGEKPRKNRWRIKDPKKE